MCFKHLISPASWERKREKDANGSELQCGKDERRTEILKGLRGLDVFERPKPPPRTQCQEALRSWWCFGCKEWTPSRMKALIISVPKTTTKFTTKNKPHGTERITSGYDNYSTGKTVKKITSALAWVIFFDVFTSNNYSLLPSYIRTLP